MLCALVPGLCPEVQLTSATAWLFHVLLCRGGEGLGSRSHWSAINQARKCVWGLTQAPCNNLQPPHGRCSLTYPDINPEFSPLAGSLGTIHLILGQHPEVPARVSRKVRETPVPV